MAWLACAGYANASGLVLAEVPDGGTVPIVGAPCIQGVALPNMVVGETRPFLAAQSTNNVHQVTAFVGVPGFTGAPAQGKLKFSLTQSGSFTDSLSVPATAIGNVAFYMKAFAVESSAFIAETYSGGCIHTGAFAITAAPPPVGQATINANWNVIGVGETRTVKVAVDYGPANFGGTMVLKERHADRVGFALSDAGPFNASIVLPITLDAQGRGSTTNVFVRGLKPTQPNDNPSAALTTLAVTSASGAVRIEPAPAWKIQVVGVARFISAWGGIGIGSVRDVQIEISGGRANFADTYNVTEQNFRTSFAAGNPIEPFVTFSSSPNGPFTSLVNIPVQTNSVGYALSPKIYVKGMRDSVGNSPSAALVAWGATVGSGNVAVLPPAPAMPINVTHPIVAFSRNTYSLGVGMPGDPFVNVFYGPPNSTGMVTIDAAGTPHLAIAASIDGSYGATLQLPVTLDAHGNGSTPVFFARGSEANSAPENLLHASYFNAVDSAVYTDSARFQVMNVQSLTLRRIGNSTPLSANPNEGGGLRVFAEKATPTDSNPARRRVQMVAQLSSAVSGVTVQFFGYDVDDPSRDLIIDPNGSAGNDNRAGGGFVFGGSKQTNGQGTAIAEFEVSAQPGDNYRFAAYVIGAENSVAYENPAFPFPAPPSINGIQLNTSAGAIDAGTYRADQVYSASQLLTVWRTLHMEVDSMGIVTGNSVAAVSILSIVPQGSGSKVTLGFPLTADRFENGRMEVAARPGFVASYKIVSNGQRYVTTSTPVSEAFLGKEPILFDDDDVSYDGSAPHGDIGEDVWPPYVDWMVADTSDPSTRNVFAPAYIVPSRDLNVGYDDDVPFVLNCPQANGTADNPTDVEVRSLTAFDNAYDQNQEFWISYIMSAYQGPERQDGDPDAEGAFLSLFDSSYGAVIFSESVFDFGAGMDETSRDYVLANDPRFLSARAIGGSLGLSIDDGGLMSEESADFSPLSIAKLRSNVFPRVGGTPQLP